MDMMEVPRKDLDNTDFINFRQTTEKIAEFIKDRLENHLATINPLFTPQKLLGSYIKGAAKLDVPGSDKAFAKLQQRYAAICATPFELKKELSVPIEAISPRLICTPYQYELSLGENGQKKTTVTSPTRYILSYESECTLNRLQAMVAGTETRRAVDMRHSLLNHLCMTIILEQLPGLKKLLGDLRYRAEAYPLKHLGGLSVVILSLPVQTFLPSDSFMIEITQLSGIPAFQEIIDFRSIETMDDPLKEAIGEYLKQ